MNPYKVLDLEPGSSKDEVRRAYRHKVLLLHPDRTGGDVESLEAYYRVVEAYREIKRGRENRGDTETQRRGDAGREKWSSPPLEVQLLRVLAHAFISGWRRVHYLTQRNTMISFTLPSRLAKTGGKVTLNTPQGAIRLVVPEHTRSGTRFRIPRRGRKNMWGHAGDLYLEVNLR